MPVRYLIIHRTENLLFILLAVILIFTACGENNEPSTPTIPKVAEVQPSDTLVIPEKKDTVKVKYVFKKEDYQYKGDYLLLTWPDLARVKFEEQYNETVEEYILYPVFNDTLKALDGKKVQIEGFVIPFEETGDETFIVLSAYPYLQCFFCGGAGPETVLDILAKDDLGRLKTDQKTTFRGKLRLNDKDLDYLNYIMDDAELVD